MAGVGGVGLKYRLHDKAPAGIIVQLLFFSLESCLFFQLCTHNNQACGIACARSQGVEVKSKRDDAEYRGCELSTFRQCSAMLGRSVALLS